MIAAIMVWAIFGLSFWVACFLFNGTPRRWKSIPRDTGWDEAIFIYIPICVVGGPLWWVALVWLRYI
jgi:hypothetical protein